MHKHINIPLDNSNEMIISELKLRVTSFDKLNDENFVHQNIFSNAYVKSIHARLGYGV